MLLRMNILNKVFNDLCDWNVINIQLIPLNKKTAMTNKKINCYSYKNYHRRIQGLFLSLLLKVCQAVCHQPKRYAKPVGDSATLTFPITFNRHYNEYQYSKLSINNKNNNFT